MQTKAWQVCINLICGLHYGPMGGGGNDGPLCVAQKNLRRHVHDHRHMQDDVGPFPTLDSARGPR